MYYFLHTGNFTQVGFSVAAGERPPPVDELAAGMKKALAGNGYVPVTDEGHRPELLILFSYGSHGANPESLVDLNAPRVPVTARELLPYVIGDVAASRDLIARARFVAGDKFAAGLKAAIESEIRNYRLNQSVGRNGAEAGLPVSPAFNSPFVMFVESRENSATMEQLAEMIFHTCYFVVASAYDFDAAEKNDRRLLWQTRMAVEARGVSLDEILSPLMATGAPFLGRETEDAVVLKKQLDREGHVEVGTPTVVGSGPQDVLPVPSTPR